MNPLATASAGSAITATSLAGLSFGAQMQASLEVVGAQSEPEFTSCYEQAKKLARLQSFVLPAQSPPFAAERYRDSVSLPFSDAMRPIIDDELQYIASGCNPADAFSEESITPKVILDSAIAGLATFEVADKALFKIIMDLCRKLEIPAPERSPLPSHNGSLPSYATASSAALVAFLHSNQEVMPLIILSAFFLYVMGRLAGNIGADIKRSDERSLNRMTRAGWQRNLILACAAHKGLLLSVDQGPHAGNMNRRPSPVQRKLAIFNRVGDKSGARIVNGADDFHVLEDTLYKYLVVELPGSKERELRIIPYDRCHTDLLILGEWIVGAGNLVLQEIEPRRRVLLFDDMSPVLPTNGSSSEGPMNHLLADDFGPEVVLDVFNSIFDGQVEVLPHLDDVREFARKSD